MQAEWPCGIDSIAHKSTLNVQGKTIAVLGCGFDNIFPEENKDLFQRIVNEGGLVISEYLPSIKAESKKFLERNRIVSGISMGILVIEAAYRSGTSVTASIAKEQGKKVMVLPHGIDEKNGVGTNRLLQKGAKLITSTKDIMMCFKDIEGIEYKEINRELEEKNIIRKPVNKKERLVFNLISKEENSINNICRILKMSVAEVNEILLNLELEGYIQKRAGGYICM